LEIPGKPVLKTAAPGAELGAGGVPFFWASLTARPFAA